MKNLLFIIVTIQLSLIKCSVPAGYHSESNGEIESQLKSLLLQKEFFKLRSYFETHYSAISNERKIYYNAFIKNAFNQNGISFRNVDTLLKYYSAALNDSEKVSLLNLQRDNYIKSFRYKKASEIDDELLWYYQEWKDSAKEAEMKNYLIIDRGLSGIQPQKVTLPLNDTITWKKDKVGLMEVPVQKNNNIYHFVFDTRASISVITQTFARKIGLTILNVSYEEHSGITGNKFISGLGIADSLYLGNVLIEHAVFQVVPDSLLNFSQIDFSINGIIGFPIIKELKEVSFAQTGQLFISKNIHKKPLNNLALDGSTTIISVKTGDDTLTFHFDLGASSTLLYHTYLERYRSNVLKSAALKTNQIGGAGGIENREVYILPHLDLYISGKKIILDSIDILTKPIYPGQKYYGNLGQDLVTKFKLMTINFEYMYIDFN